jgi:hypothetical protein
VLQGVDGTAGMAGCGSDRTGEAGRAGLGSDWTGLARSGRRGDARTGAGGRVWLVEAGAVWRGGLRYVLAWQVRSGREWFVREWSGTLWAAGRVWKGRVWSGLARQVRWGMQS